MFSLPGAVSQVLGAYLNCSESIGSSDWSRAKGRRSRASTEFRMVRSWSRSKPKLPDAGKIRACYWMTCDLGSGAARAAAFRNSLQAANRIPRRDLARRVQALESKVGGDSLLLWSRCALSSRPAASSHHPYRQLSQRELVPRVRTRKDGGWELGNLQLLPGQGRAAGYARLPPSRTAAPSSAPALQFLGSAAPASKGSGEASLLMVARSTP